MARYKLTLAYDGTAFHGSQRQAGRRTVQSEVEAALQRLGWQDGRIIMAGRTDAGVHARGQVASADIGWRRSAAELKDVMNNLLPADLALIKVEVAPQAFHARFDANSRRYVYRTRIAPDKDPLEERFAWRIWPLPEIPVLNRLAEAILGPHDFGAFGSAPKKGGSTRRTVKRSLWRRSKGFLLYEIVANGFLYRMVRRLVYVQVKAAQGRCPEFAVVRALRGRGGGAALLAGLAPASGLVLAGVDYEREHGSAS